jgi:ABC-type histidine transport system ATPase subunit
VVPDPLLTQLRALEADEIAALLADSYVPDLDPEAVKEALQVILDKLTGENET